METLGGMNNVGGNATARRRDTWVGAARIRQEATVNRGAGMSSSLRAAPTRRRDLLALSLRQWGGGLGVRRNIRVSEGHPFRIPGPKACRREGGREWVEAQRPGEAVMQRVHLLGLFDLVSPGTA